MLFMKVSNPSVASPLLFFTIFFYGILLTYLTDAFNITFVGKKLCLVVFVNLILPAFYLFN